MMKTPMKPMDQLVPGWETHLQEAVLHPGQGEKDGPQERCRQSKLLKKEWPKASLASWLRLCRLLVPAFKASMDRLCTPPLLRRTGQRLSGEPEGQESSNSPMSKATNARTGSR